MLATSFIFLTIRSIWKMKKATKYLKHLFSAIVAAVKARSTAVGTKASSLQMRLIVLGIMRNKKLLLSAIQKKIHAIIGAGNGSGNAVASHGSGNRMAAVLQSLPSFAVEQETRALVLLSSLPSFVLERDAAGAGANEDKQDVVEATAGDKHVAVVDDDATAQAKAEGDFLLEDQIDHVADVFIRRFHEQMRLQKLESFKRFCEMLERGA